MDEIVLRGLAKWPNVPAVYGWLSLDRRGQWRIKGKPITNPMVNAYIGRNYERGADGSWFFQNGPQRVYVSLDYTPYVYRVAGAAGAPLAFESHSGRGVSALRGTWIDENGAMLLESEYGVGVVLDRDLDRLFPHLVDIKGNPPPENVVEQAIESLAMRRNAPLWIDFVGNRVRIDPIASREVATRFGFIAEPQPPAGAGEICR